MKLLTTLTMAAILVGSVWAAPLDTAYVPAEAKWIAHTDLEAFAANHIGQLAMGEVRSRYPSKVERIQRHLGSDLTRDIHGLTLYGPDSSEALAVALIYGNFDPAKLIALLQRNAAYDQSEYGDRILYHWHDNRRNRPQVGTFATENLIVISETAQSVQTALDVIDGNKEALAAQPQTPLLSLVEGTQGAFFVAAADDLSTLTATKSHAAILKNSRMMSISAEEIDNQFRLNVFLEANDTEAAKKVEQIANGMVAYAALQEDHSDLMMPLIQACKLTRTDALLSFEFSYPSEELFALFQAHQDELISEGKKVELIR